MRPAYIEIDGIPDDNDEPGVQSGTVTLKGFGELGETLWELKTMLVGTRSGWRLQVQTVKPYSNTNGNAFVIKEINITGTTKDYQIELKANLTFHPPELVYKLESPCVEGSKMRTKLCSVNRQVSPSLLGSFEY